MKRRNIIHKALSFTLAGTMALGLAACGGGGTGTRGGFSDTLEEGFVYVPQFYELATGEEEYISTIQNFGEKVYYNIISYGEGNEGVKGYAKETTDLSKEAVLLWEHQTAAAGESEYENTIMNTLLLGEEGRIDAMRQSPILDYNTATAEDWERQEKESIYSLRRLTEEGTVRWEMDITPYMQQSEYAMYISGMACDKDGNIYLTDNSSYVLVFDAEGKHICDINLEESLEGGYVCSMGTLSDGRVAILADGMNDMTIMVWDLNSQKFTDTYNNLPPNCYNAHIIPGAGNTLLLNGDGTLYEYDVETQTYEAVLKWIDCDMNTDYVNSVFTLENGDILVYYNDWSSGEDSLVLLKKTAADQVVKKEYLTLGCMGISQELQSAVVKFNKENEKYKIQIIDYTEAIDWSAEGAYEDAKTRFLNELITGNGPDIFPASEVNLAQFVEKGIIEDLTPYLEESTVINRDELFASVLDAMTFDDVLCSIPNSFSVSALVGRASELGDRKGFTIEELFDYLAQYPDADWLPYVTSNSVLMYTLMFDMDSYVNWETGECAFDGAEFKKILELAADYYDVEPDYEISTPKLLANHQVLMDTLSIYAVNDYQIAELLFGEPVSVVGYPTFSGEGGIVMSPNNGLCINATSAYKDVAWSFVESLLTKEAYENTIFMYGLPINKSVYNDMLEEQMTADYLTDENGELILDEEGNPIEISNHSYGWEDVTFDIYAATEEDAEQLMNIIEGIDKVMNYDEKLINIIIEEAESYFTGQKSVDEVADIIQSRAKIYVNESR